MSQADRLSAAISAQFEQQLDFLRRLIRTKSSNPFTPDTSPPAAPIEREVADLIQHELRQLGLHPALHGISAQRPNVICHVHGSEATENTLILTTHMDTVEPGNYTCNPWGAQIEEGRVYGVGAADAKAQIAIFVYALQAVRKAHIPLAGNVTLAFVVDEEAGACSPYGTRYLLEQGFLRGNAAIIGEPGNEKIALGHRGLYRFRIQTRGEAIHTGMKAWERKSRGQNAIVAMADIIQALASVSLPPLRSPAFPGRTSVLTFPTLIRGGTGVNIVPDFCEAYGDVRLLPGLAAGDVRSLIEAQLAQIPQHAYQIEDVISIPAVEIEPGTAIVHCLKEAVEEVTGTSPRLEGSGPACDGWMFITRGIPAICGYGAACGGVHGADEWVDIESVRTATEIYAHAIISYFTA